MHAITVQLPRYDGFIFRSCYSTVLRSIDARYDVRGSFLAELIKSCLRNRAKIPPPVKEFFQTHVQPEAISAIEFLTVYLLFGPKGRFSPNEYRYKLKCSSISNPTLSWMGLDHGEDWEACSSDDRLLAQNSDEKAPKKNVAQTSSKAKVR